MPQSKNLMIVEDSEELVEVWKTLFRATTDYRIRCCHSGNAAREAIMEGYEPSLVVTDYYLGDSTGLELYDYMSKKLPATKFVMVTGNHEDEEMLRLQKDGQMSLLLKPVKFEVLRQAVSEALN